MTQSDTLLADADVTARLAATLPRWRLAEGAITRTFRTGGWRATLMVVNAIGHLAEVAWHHPDLAVSYASVVVRLSTHSAGGVTEKDLALAARIEALVAWNPAREGGALEGLPADDPALAYLVGE